MKNIILVMVMSVFCGCFTNTREINPSAKREEVREEIKQEIKQITPEKSGGEKMIVKKGNKVKVHYEGSLTDGTVFDKSKEGKPLEFVVGGGQMIAGFDKAVEGMELNEEKTVTIEAEKAYGKRNENLVRKFPKSFVPENSKVEKGMQIIVKGPDGSMMPARITDIDAEGSVTVDLNHFLAGKDLVFKIKVISIE